MARPAKKSNLAEFALIDIAHSTGSQYVVANTSHRVSNAEAGTFSDASSATLYGSNNEVNRPVRKVDLII